MKICAQAHRQRRRLHYLNCLCNSQAFSICYIWFGIFILPFSHFLLLLFCCMIQQSRNNTFGQRIQTRSSWSAKKTWICSNCSLIKWIHQIAHKNSSQCAFYSAFYAHGLRVIHPMKNVNDKIDCTHHRCTSTPYIVLMQKQ